jgi:hypothetical protein
MRKIHTVIFMFFIVFIVVLFNCTAQDVEKKLDISKDEFSQFENELSYQPTRLSFTKVIGDSTISKSIYEQATAFDSLIPMQFYRFFQTQIVSLYYLHGINEDIKCFDSIFTVRHANNMLLHPHIKPLEKLMYVYMNLEHIKLKKEKKIRKEDRKLIHLYYQYIRELWLKGDGRIYSLEQRYIGTRSRVANLLTSNEDFTPKYLGGITDHEFFQFACATSMLGINLKYKQRPSMLLKEMAYYNLECYKRFVSINESGWLYQPGVWSDHPDFKYAGNQTKGKNLQVKEIDNIVWDASHFSRVSLFLETLSNIFKINSDELKYINELKIGLSKQFLNRVVVFPDKNGSAIRFNNFMDGNNGIYRYKYVNENDLGIGPFANDTHVYMGFWAFLNTDTIIDLYYNMANGNYKINMNSNSKDASTFQLTMEIISNMNKNN